MRPLLSLVLLATAASASAQPGWRTVPADGPVVSLDVLKLLGADQQIITDDQGNVLGDGGPGLLESAQILAVRVPLGPVFSVVADLPTAYASYSVSGGLDDEFSYREFGVGNPYLGAEAAVRPDAVVEGGVRLPLGSQALDGPGVTARYAGFTTLFEAPEAYLEGTFTASLGGRFEPALSPALRLRLRAVPGVAAFSYRLLDAGDGEAPGEVSDVYYFLQYGTQLVGLVGPTEVSGGVIGQAHTWRRAEPAALVLSVAARDLPVRPGLSVRVPFEDYSFSGADAVVGFSLDVPLR